ncbi:MAG: transcriptional regulator [Bacteroidota bacterium]|nr:transcriptional regulator [Bacteroidota bacterium]
MSDEKVLKNLGKRVAELRTSKGLTQTELAYACDIEQSNLARIEAGNTNPTFLTLHKLSIALQVTMIELIDINYK